MDDDDFDGPLDTTPLPNVHTQIPGELVVAVAQGLEEPVEIASRLGIPPKKWEKIEQYPPFQAAVAAKRAELAKSGWVFRTKAAMQAEMLMDQVFVKAMSNETSLGMKLETLKYLTKAGNLEPKEEKGLAQGTGFTISINLGAHSVQLGNHQAEALPMVEEATTVTPKTHTPVRAIDTLDIPLEDFDD